MNESIDARFPVILVEDDEDLREAIAVTLCSAERICEPTSLALGAVSIDAVASLEFVCGTSGG